jgi:hypothetical protein
VIAIAVPRTRSARLRMAAPRLQTHSSNERAPRRLAARVIDTASRCAKNGSPARDPAQGNGEGLPLVCARPGAIFWVHDHAAKLSKHSVTPRALAEAPVVRLLISARSFCASAANKCRMKGSTSGPRSATKNGTR